MLEKKILHQFRFNKRFDSKAIIALIALIIAGISIWKSCSQQDQIDKINFQRMAEDYRPKINVGILENTTIKVNIDTARIKRELEDSRIDKKGHYHINLVYELRLKYILKLYNSGNSQANLLGYTMMDSVYQGMLLHEKIKNKSNLLKMRTSIEPTFVTIDSGDTIFIEIEQPIINLQQNEFQIHFYIFYENQLKILYSTYSWIKYQITLPELFELNPDSTVKNIHLNIKLDNNHMSFIRQLNYPKIVALEDTLMIREFIYNNLRQNTINTNKLFPDIPKYPFKIPIN